MSLKYHLRIFALGVPLIVAGFSVIYGLTLLPLWMAETPFFILMAYIAGRAVELWARRP